MPGGLIYVFVLSRTFSHLFEKKFLCETGLLQFLDLAEMFFCFFVIADTYSEYSA